MHTFERAQPDDQPAAERVTPTPIRPDRRGTRELRLRRPPRDLVVQRLLDPAFEDQVFADANRRDRDDVGAVGTIAANDPRRAQLSTHLQETGRSTTPTTPTPTPGKIAANDPRQAQLNTHLQETGRSTTPTTPTPTPGKIAANDPRLHAVASNLPVRGTRKATEEAKAKEAAREQVFQLYVSGANLVLGDQTASYVTKLRLLHKRWETAKGIGVKGEITDTKADLDRHATVGAKSDREEQKVAALIAAREKQKKEYDQRFTVLLVQVPTRIQNVPLQTEVLALLKAIKAEIDLINTKGGNISSNFATDLQASAKGTYSPQAVANAGPAWSSGLYRFAASDQKYRGPHQKGAQSLAAATVDLPQANFEAPIADGAKGKINVHVSVGTKSGNKAVDSYTMSVDDANKQTNIHPAEIIRMVKYYRDDPQPLGVSRKGKAFFSAYDISLLRTAVSDGARSTMEHDLTADGAGFARRRLDLLDR